ncbi:hypothetical protein [Staphylococcus saprophyticus]|uniref:hypothetical protein n=1 Tax=Staphylococcus saprophyticus TaxID=29385 RepID=UPI0011A050E9|nr:hypothetical protein [Staphylococcus saprophyticus]MCM3121458.1 hypothetical protein [Staphylococcus saprophyticus]
MGNNTVYTLIWSETYGEVMHLGVFPTKSEAEAEIENNLATRDIDEDFIEESKADEYTILETQINEADITKIV